MRQEDYGGGGNQKKVKWYYKIRNNGSYEQWDRNYKR